MKKILGLDLGVSSIGWALIEENDSEKKILGMGTRIVPLSTDDIKEFTSGNAITRNQERRQKRMQRRRYDRFQLRRDSLIKVLSEKNMMPGNDLINANKLHLWELRSKASEQQIGLQEIGRVLLHLNQKRGYKSVRKSVNADRKETEYVSEIKNRYEKLKETGKTIGQFFYENLLNDRFYRIKNQVFPREAYIEEYDRIMAVQKNFYPETLTDDFIDKVKNEIIYYQRPLKSQKKLVSLCEFEKKTILIDDGKGGKTEAEKGPRVAHRSSPLFQICRIWENINNIKIKDKYGKDLIIPHDKKLEIFNYLDNNEKLRFSDLLKILNLKSNDGWTANSMLDKGITGHTTKVQILKCLNNTGANNNLLKFEIKFIERDKILECVDRETGEIIIKVQERIVDRSIEKEPLYRLWHTIYSINNEKDCINALIRNFNIPEESAKKLANLDFTKEGYGNKSVKAIRKILPYLMDGFGYSDACCIVGYNHSDSLTKEERVARELLDRLPLLKKNTLRQPIVEKILNQMINLVNSIMDNYCINEEGEKIPIDEIRIELARELKQNMEERRNTTFNINRRERENEAIRKRLVEEYGQRATRNNVLKWRLFHSVRGDESKVNNICVYCGKPFGITDALAGIEVDVEHILPRTLFFDDSENNKVLAHRKCNQDKGNMTAYDFMYSKGEKEFNDFIERVNHLYSQGLINKIKKERLLTPAEGIPKDFIKRQLRETQYISRKAVEILSMVCREVNTTSGSVTDFLRRLWGWDDVLMNLHLPAYRNAGLTEWIDIEKDGHSIKKEIIPDWTKRLDHRHHAIDALVIACTKQGFIQRINNLSSEITREDMYKEIAELEDIKAGRRTLLEKYLAGKQPFSTAEVEKAATGILVSFKSGKKVATQGTRKVKIKGHKKIVQEGIIVPRGPLSEESVYGKIKILDKHKPVKYLFENPHLIFKNRIKRLVEERIEKFDGDVKKAYNSIKREPIYLDEAKTVKLEYGTCYREEYVIKYPVGSLKPQDVNSIVDEEIRRKFQKRLEEFKGNEKNAFKDLENNPVWYDEEKKIPVRSVRCFTGLSMVEPVRYNEKGEPVGYVKPGNNHHIAIYEDNEGNKYEHVCTFWHAVERKKFGLPVIIENPTEVWNQILNEEKELPEDFLKKLPLDGWKFLTSLQQNEMFLLGMPDEEIEKAISENDNALLSRHLYRVQKITSKDYFFRHHLETEINDNADALKLKKFYRIKSIKSFEQLNPVKVRINLLGQLKV